MTLPTPEFASLTEPLRPELLAHCYRMVGSLEEAQDLVQETFLRAWQSHRGFEGRSSVRTWLYRIATNVCLTRVERSARRRLPATSPKRTDGAEGPWLQPLPDALVPGLAPGVAEQAEVRESVRLALVAALQNLSARQRAALILTDVLDWSAREVAEALGTTVPAVKSLLQRARARVQALDPPDHSSGPPAEHPLLLEYIRAFEQSDPQALEAALCRDVLLELPPSAQWYAGPEALVCATGALGHPGDWKLFPTAANGQPAAVVYHRNEGVYRAFAVVVLTLGPGGIARITVFGDPTLVLRFGFPDQWP